MHHFMHMPNTYLRFTYIRITYTRLRRLFQLLWLTVLMVLPFTLCYADYISTNQTLVSATPQNTSAFLNNISGIKNFNQKIPPQRFLKHYFAPWNNDHLYSKAYIAYIKNDELDTIKNFTKKPGYGANGLIHDEKWIDQIAHNMNLDAFPNLKMKAITVRNTHVRALPTIDPSFKTWSVGGDGYPFDNLETSLVPANTPVVVIHTSKDGAWYLVHTSAYWGWLPSADVAFVSNRFMQTWQSH